MPLFSGQWPRILPPLALAEALPNMIEGGVFAVERGDDPMAQQQAKPALDTVDPVWARIRREAEETVRRAHPAVSGELTRQAYAEALKDIPALGETFRADLMATVDRDPATHRMIE